MRAKYFWCFLAFIILLSSCNKGRFNFSEGDFSFSEDTVIFDTVFTTIGSTTSNVRIFNGANNGINFDEVKLMGGSSSPFRLNIDGLSFIETSDVEIFGNDSLYMFVEVTLDVNGTSNPLIIEDSVLFRSGTTEKYLKLAVWGQDAYFYNDEVVSGLWSNDKPHVVYGLAAVGYPGIDSNLVLDIEAGTMVHFHNNSQLIVYKSELNVNGTLGNEVNFCGDRLEAYYDDVPGQWWGIRYIEAENCNMDYAIVKNASIGIQIDSCGLSDPTLNISNSQVFNNDFFSLYAVAGAKVSSTNSVFGSSGVSSAYYFAGGKYDFINCTFANYWGAGGSSEAFILQNYFQATGGVTYIRPLETAYFRNCVFEGSNISEFNVDTILHPSCDIVFENCAAKSEIEYSGIGYINMFYNQSVNFTDGFNNDFHFQLPSVLNENASPIWSPAFDIEGNTRDAIMPDIGAYEL
jgi:hypothetical protein